LEIPRNPHKIPSSEEFEKVTSVNTLELAIRAGVIGAGVIEAGIVTILK
jgi:hypothetical protein